MLCAEELGYFGRSSKRAINAIQLDYKSIKAYNAPVIFRRYFILELYL